MRADFPEDTPATFWSRLVQRMDRRQLIGFLLLAILMATTSAGIHALNRSTNDLTLPFMTLIGLALTWRMAGGRRSWVFVTIASLSIGVTISILYAGQLGGETLALLKSAARLLWDWPGRPPGSPPPDTTIASSLAIDLLGRVQQLLAGGWAWAANMARGKPVFDARASVLVWSVLMWCASVWAAWWVRRRTQALVAAAPAMLLFALSSAYTRNSAVGLAAALAALLALMAWGQFTKRQRAWQQSAIDMAEDLPFDLTVWASVVCLGVAGLSLAAAGPSPQQAFHAAQRFLLQRGSTTTQIGEALGLESQPATGSNATTGMTGVLPRQHLLRGRVALNQRVAMLVQTPPLPFSVTLPYLRAVTYDVYTGQGWISSPTEKIVYPTGQALPHIATPGQAVAFSVQMMDASDVQIYSPGELMWVDQPVHVDWRSPGKIPDAFGARLQIPGSAESGKQPNAPLSYRAAAWVSPIGESELRQAGNVYPAEIAGRYLQLPEALPQRVRSLAGSLTSRKSTAYDRAKAIETYLRSYRYSLDLPDPPLNRDLVDFFLFELRAGYCDYNASAMVILARAAGIPARLAIGYALPRSTRTTAAEDRSEVDAAATVITEDLAHSWPELYFPGWGWVTFEPTGGRAPRTIAETRPAFAAPTPVQPDATAKPAAKAQQPRWLVLLIGAVMLVFLLAFGVNLWNGRHLRGKTELTRMYIDLRHESQRLGVRLYPGQTPAELSAALIERMAASLKPGRLSRWISPTREQIKRLVALYAETEYGRSSAAADELFELRHSWLALRMRLWMVRLGQLIEQTRKTRPE